MSGNAVAEHGDSIGAHAERKALVDLGINAAVTQDDRDGPCPPRDRQPAVRLHAGQPTPPQIRQPMSNATMAR